MEKNEENENKKVVCEIKCLKCGKWFESAIQFGGAEPFDTSTLIGNKQQCPFCGYLTDCNKENMRFTERKSDGFVYHHEGKDTL